MTGHGFVPKDHSDPEFSCTINTLIRLGIQFDRLWSVSQDMDKNIKGLTASDPNYKNLPRLVVLKNELEWYIELIRADGRRLMDDLKQAAQTFLEKKE